jgi:hypothetical protein
MKQAEEIRDRHLQQKQKQQVLEQEQQQQDQKIHYHRLQQAHVQRAHFPCSSDHRHSSLDHIDVFDEHAGSSSQNCFWLLQWMTNT